MDLVGRKEATRVCGVRLPLPPTLRVLGQRGGEGVRLNLVADALWERSSQLKKTQNEH